MRVIREIIVHCTATRPEWWADKTAEQKAEECRRWHVEGNGWSDIGYHYLIDRDGTITPGRPMGRPGAHTRGRNENSVGIALWGGHGAEKTDLFDMHFTAQQDAALRKLIAELQDAHGAIPVHGHNEFSAKGCPGFHAPSWFADKPKVARTSPAQSKTIQSTIAATAGTVATGATAIGSLDGTAQLVAIGGVVVVAVALLVIFRERLKKWTAGDR